MQVQDWNQLCRGTLAASTSHHRGISHWLRGCGLLLGRCGDWRAGASPRELGGEIAGTYFHEHYKIIMIQLECERGHGWIWHGWGLGGSGLIWVVDTVQHCTNFKRQIATLSNRESGNEKHLRHSATKKFYNANNWFQTNWLTTPSDNSRTWHMMLYVPWYSIFLGLEQWDVPVPLVGSLSASLFTPHPQHNQLSGWFACAHIETCKVLWENLKNLNTLYHLSDWTWKNGTLYHYTLGIQPYLLRKCLGIIDYDVGS